MEERGSLRQLVTLHCSQETEWNTGAEEKKDFFLFRGWGQGGGPSPWMALPIFRMCLPTSVNPI